MRTTLDLPDPVFRDLKVKAAAEGVTLKQLLTGFVEKGLYGTDMAKSKPVRSPLPPPLKSRGVTIPSLTNAEIDEIFLEEDMERWGIKTKS
ncbi:hypothetical protein OKA04_19250 [Luteolibacter flavescens]|uniref:Antitoxin n=1 Tax=Luteolibacter flavescens TaxID=1859460 RepID=A0ABT3FV87_9BACT|nr:hypothetical protein [Luteolibacter flavescens]MCW1886885.1 hypothetical protein [Luteolibacter flavescens]